MSELKASTALHHYVEVDEQFFHAYESYQPDIGLIEQIRAVRPAAHVVTPSRYTCKDCVRNIPQMARIAEHLPGWTWDVFDSKADPERRAALNITHIPTFIVYDGDSGHELGRIVENPVSGSLEYDLLQLVESSRK